MQSSAMQHGVLFQSDSYGCIAWWQTVMDLYLDLNSDGLPGVYFSLCTTVYAPLSSAGTERL